MQLGSGTYDLLPSLTYVQQFENWSYGAQANAVIRLESENDNGYRLGDVWGATTWVGTNLSEWIGLNTGLNYTYTSKLKGSQDDVGTMGPNGKSVTTAYESNYRRRTPRRDLRHQPICPKWHLKRPAYCCRPTFATLARSQWLPTRDRLHAYFGLADGVLSAYVETTLLSLSRRYQNGKSVASTEVGVVDSTPAFWHLPQQPSTNRKKTFVYSVPFVVNRC